MKLTDLLDKTIEYTHQRKEAGALNISQCFYSEDKDTRTTAAALYGEYIISERDPFSGNIIFIFSNGKRIEVDPIEVSAANDIINCIMDKIASYMGTVYGDKKQTRDFADCEVNRQYTLDSIENEEDDGL